MVVINKLKRDNIEKIALILAIIFGIICIPLLTYHFYIKDSYARESVECLYSSVGIGLNCFYERTINMVFYNIFWWLCIYMLYFPDSWPRFYIN